MYLCHNKLWATAGICCALSFCEFLWVCVLLYSKASKNVIPHWWRLENMCSVSHTQNKQSETDTLTINIQQQSWIHTIRVTHYSLIISKLFHHGNSYKQFHHMCTSLALEKRWRSQRGLPAEIKVIFFLKSLLWIFMTSTEITRAFQTCNHRHFPQFLQKIMYVFDLMDYQIWF